MRWTRIFNEQKLFEAAVSVEQAVKEKLCLHINKFGSFVIFLLYDPKIISNNIDYNSFYSGLDETLCLQSIISGIQISSKDLGSDFKKPKISKYVMNLSVSTQKGYGVLLYDIVLSYVGKGGICPDRRNVSDKAKSVWEYYDNNRSDVKSIPIDNKEKPLTKSLDDDGTVHDEVNQIKNTSYLDKVYYMTSPKNYKPLLQNSKEFLQKLQLKHKKVYNMLFDFVLNDVSTIDYIYRQVKGY